MYVLPTKPHSSHFLSDAIASKQRSLATMFRSEKRIFPALRRSFMTRIILAYPVRTGTTKQTNTNTNTLIDSDPTRQDDLTHSFPELAAQRGRAGSSDR